MKVKTLFNPERGSALTPTGYSLIKGYLSDYPILPEIPQDLTDRIIDEINQGVIIVNYGHGSTQNFAHGDIVYPDDVPNLSNDQRLPVMVIMTCLNGCFVMPNFLSSSEEILLVDGAGAVAAFASRGMITMPNLNSF